jgi:hypothetical protein
MAVYASRERVTSRKQPKCRHSQSGQTLECLADPDTSAAHVIMILPYGTPSIHYPIRGGDFLVNPDAYCRVAPAGGRLYVTLRVLIEAHLCLLTTRERAVRVERMMIVCRPILSSTIDTRDQ